MNRLNKKLKSTLLDLAGVLLIIIAGLIGWLPGPGGIPLLIAGLGLLSINHEWAKRWMQSAQKHGVKISNKIFNGSRAITITIDAVGVACIGIAVLIVFLLTGTVAKTVAVWLAVIAIVLLLGNRNRLSRILKRH